MSKISNKIFRGEAHYITSKYGYRNPISTENGVTSSFHNGTDYGTHSKKLPQYAIEKGNVLVAGTASDGGKFVWVEYPRIKKKMLHYHLDSIKVKSGQEVDENTILGTTGTTGRSTGIHLHLSVVDLVTGKCQDPEVFAASYVEPIIEPVAPVEPPKPVAKLKIGDKVEIIGKGNANSFGNGLAAGGIGWTRSIIGYIEGRNFPYRVGNSTGTTGWYKETALKKVK